MKPIKLAIGALVVVAFMQGPAVGAELSGYTVEKLLEPCVEGDNDSRWGAAAEAECEQYIKGFTDAVVMLESAIEGQICLPAGGNRADEIRWAFMRWAHKNYGDRGMPAADGLMAVLKESFPCQ